MLLGGLILGALMYGVVMTIDWANAQRDRYSDALGERSAAVLAQAAARRATSTPQDEAAITDMRSWGLRADNIAVAQVNLEQLIRTTATEAGLANVQVTTDSEVTEIGPTQWLGAQIQADLRWAPTFAFLDAMTGWQEGFRVIAFEYELTDQPTGFVPRIASSQARAAAAETPTSLGRLRMEISVPVTLATPEPE